MGYVKRDAPSAPRLHAKKREEERLAEKRTPLPKPPPIKTEKEKEELRARMKEKYEKKYDIPERILFMALESVLYDEEQANNLITTMIEDDLKRQKVKALVKTSLLVSSSDYHLDLLLILCLSNSTNLQIVRQRCCLLPRICYFCHRTDILIVGIGRIASSLTLLLFNSKLVCAHTMPPLQCLILPPWRGIHLLLTLYLNSAALSLLCILDLRLERQH